MNLDMDVSCSYGHKNVTVAFSITLSVNLLAINIYTEYLWFFMQQQNGMLLVGFNIRNLLDIIIEANVFMLQFTIERTNLEAFNIQKTKQKLRHKEQKK